MNSSRRFACTAALIASLSFASAPTRADDSIFNLGSSVLPAIAADIGELFQGEAGLAQIVKQVFSQSQWNPDIINALNPAEHPVGAATFPIGQTKFKGMILGAANLKDIRGPFIYDEIQGGVGVEYDIIQTTGKGAALVALRFSPLYAEIAAARTISSQLPIPNLPAEGFLGSSLGVEMSKRFGDVTIGTSANARELFELNDSKVSGLAFYAAAYAKIKIAEVTAPKDSPHTAFYIHPTLNYYDRGAQLEDMYALGLARRFVEALVYFEIN